MTCSTKTPLAGANGSVHAAAGALPTRDHPREGGFTLLEVLVAFAVMSVVLAPLLEGGVTGVHAVETAGLTEQAVSIARSQLSSFDAAPSHAAADLQGDEGRYHWRLQVAPLLTIPVQSAGARRSAPTTLYHIAVTVSWQAGGRRSSVRLATDRLTPVPPVLP